MPQSPAAESGGISRRTLLRAGAGSAALLSVYGARSLVAPGLARQGLLNPDGIFTAASSGISDKLYLEDMPTSPLVLYPFTDPLYVPRALAPVPRSVYSNWPNPPGPGDGQQNSLRNERHQIWPSAIGAPDPLVYKLDLMLGL